MSNRNQHRGEDSAGTAGIRLSEEQRIDWLRLIRSENVGPRTFRTLVNHYGGARGALAALPDLARRGGAAGTARIHSREEAVAELRAGERLGVMLLALGEPYYPDRLQNLPDAPPLLAVRGALACLDRPMVAIVGSRNASAAGLKMAERLAHTLGQDGFVIVSGLARGIDAAAHRASLASGTIAVLAGGQDRIYPPEHAGLLDSILDSGAAVSEMPLSWEPRARDFPRRNRLISGLTAGVIVVEAARRSGSLITARMALEQNRELFAVPGSPLDPRAEGTNGLLKQGAILVTDAEDVRSVLEPILGQHLGAVTEPKTDDSPLEELAGQDRARVLALLGPTPVSLDDLIRLAGASPAVVRTVLLELELAGRLDRHGGGLVALVS